MTWFKVDDSFHAHPKVLATDPAALGLWVVAGAWSSANLTNGFVPDHALPRLLPDSATLARALVAAGLWRKVRGGHQFHDWTDYNPTANDVRDIRQKRAAAGRLGGIVSAERRAAVTKTRPGRDLNSTMKLGDRDLAVTKNGATNNQDDSGSVAADQRKAGSKPQANASALANSVLEPPTRPDPTQEGLRARASPPPTNGTPGPGPEPPSTCDEHRDNPSPPPCGRCADARRHHDQWQTDRRRRLAAAPVCRRHRGQLAHNCALCRAERLGGEP